MKRVRYIAGTVERLEYRELLTASSSVPHIIDSPEIGRVDMTLGDLDGDEDLDLVFTDGTVGWKENRGDGTFHFRKDLGKSEDQVDSVFLVDLDQDGDVDIVTMLSRRSQNDGDFADLGWLENLDGKGGFSAQQHLATVPVAEDDIISHVIDDLQFADVDRDSDLDIVYWRQRRQSEHFRHLRYVPFLIRNDGTEFVDDGRFSSIDTTSGAAITDLDGDGHVDLVVRHDSIGQFDWYRNTDQGLAKQEPIMFADPYWRFVDFDNDGDADLGGYTGIYFNDGNAGFIQEEAFDFDIFIFEFGMEFEFADIDADGDFDVIYHTHAAHNLSGFRTVINHEGEFLDSEIIRDWFYSFAYGDVTGDGKLDLLFQGHRWSRPGGNILLFDAFGEQRAITDRSAPPSSVTVRDIDSDGDPDLIVSSINYTGVHSDNPRPLAAAHWYENLGELNFGPRQLIAQGSTNVEFGSDMVADIGDLDDDGKVDMVTAFRDEITIHYDYFGDSRSVILDTSLQSRYSNALDVKVVDFDEDGDRDIVFIRDWGILVAMNGGERQFDVVKPAVDTSCHYSSAQDIDADGDLDLLSLQYIRIDDEVSASYAWSENVGGTFRDCQRMPELTFEDVNFKFADFDGDGDLDRVRFDTPGNPRNSRDGALIIDESRPVGDVNNDGQFDSADLMLVFSAGEYEDQIVGNSTYEDGDWNGDGEFDSADIVAVFQAASYVRNVHAARGIMSTQVAGFVNVTDDSNQSLRLT